MSFKCAIEAYKCAVSETLYPLGEDNIKLEYAGQEYSLPLIVVPKGSNALFGRNWLQDVKLEWPNLPA